MKRFISITLALCLLLALAACGKKDDDAPATATPPEEAGYTSTGLELPVELGRVASFFAGNGRLYILHTTTGADGADTYRLTSLDEAGGDPQVLLDWPNAADACLDADGTLWALIYGEDSVPGLLYFAPDGSSGELPLPEEVYAKLLPQTFKIDDDGNFYLFAYDNTQTFTYALSPAGEFLFELPMTGLPLAIIRTAEGQVGVCPYDMNAVAAGALDFELCLIDPAMKSWGQALSIGLPQGGLYGGISNSFYVNDTTDVYAYDLEGGEPEVLFNWLDVDLAADQLILAELSGGRFAVLSARIINQVDMTFSYSLAILERGDGTARAQKQVLTLAGLIPNNTASIAAAEFNKTSENYRIEVKSYLSYNDITSGDNVTDVLNTALLQFSNDIITGNIPDILDLYYMPADLYAAKGLLEDLYTYIDADPDFERGDFFENLLDAMSIDGKLSYISNTLYIYTLMGDARVLGTEPGITAAGLGAILDTSPDMKYPLGPLTTKDVLLTNILYGNLDFIDWDTGICHFDSPDFIALLELANRLPAEPGEFEIDLNNLASALESSASISDGDQLAAIESILSIDQLASYNRRLAGRTSIVGLPSQEGVCHVMDAIGKLSISSKSEHKDVAWDFIRTLLADDVPLRNSMLPVTRSAFAQMAQDALDGKSLLGTAYYEGLEIQQSDVDMLQGLMEATHYATSYDQVVMDIVLDESAAYFAGDLSAAQVAANIQSRVQIYVSEQR